MGPASLAITSSQLVIVDSVYMIAQLTKAIIYTESTITSCEDVIAREAGRTTRTSSCEPSSYTSGSPSITTPSYTHRARGAGHSKDREIFGKFFSIFGSILVSYPH